MESGVFAASPKIPRFQKAHAVLAIGDFLDMEGIQSRFDAVPLDGYVKEGFRKKSICRVQVKNQVVNRTKHGPLYQPEAYNPVHGGIVREYEEMEPALTVLLRPLIQIFAACAELRDEHEILVQAQRVTATSGEDGATGFPVVEGWHQDNTQVLAIFMVNKVNVEGGVSLLSRDRSGQRLTFARTLEIGELLLIDDTTMWHNTTPIRKVHDNVPSYRDIVILTWPSCREDAAFGGAEERRLGAVG
jgi:hypothetical protein